MHTATTAAGWQEDTGDATSVWGCQCPGGRPNLHRSLLCPDTGQVSINPHFAEQTGSQGLRDLPKALRTPHTRGGI